MEFRKRFILGSPLSEVIKFHSRSTSMAAITPPPIIIQIHSAPPVLAEGDIMEFTLWFGPIPIRWKALIENISDDGFDDRLISGPFRKWVHHHRFAAIDKVTTEIEDVVEVQLSLNPFWLLLGIGMWLGMPLLFAFRAWKTRRLLEKKALV